jgi:curved DNA-binding protein CbpA
LRSSPINHYERLGVESDASPAAVRAAYHELARLLHPDTHGGAANREMALVNEAWRVLSDPGRRAAYDATLRLAAPVASPRPTWDDLQDDDADVLDFDDGDAGDGLGHAPWLGRALAATTVVIAIGLSLLFVYAFSRSGR